MLIALLAATEASIAFLILSNMTFGKINERSKQVICSLRGHATRNMNVWDKKLMLEYLSSYRPLRVELGPLGHYHKRNTLKVIGKIILYTTKFLLISMKYK
jgi:hypothetical protein